MKFKCNCSPLLNSKVRKCAFRIAAILCLIPWYDSKKEDLVYNRLNKLYAFFYSVFFVTVLSLFCSPWKNDISDIETALHKLSVVIKVGLYITLAYNIIFLKQIHFIVYFRRLGNIIFLRNKQYKNYGFSNSFHIHFVVGHVIFIMVYCFSIYQLLVAKHFKFLGFLLFDLIVTYPISLLSMTLSYVVLIIRFQYVSLQKCLEEIYMQVSSESEEDIILRKLVYIEKIYMITSDLTDYFNLIEGWKMIWIISNSVIELITFVNVLASYNAENHYFNRIIPPFLITGLHLVSRR